MDRALGTEALEPGEQLRSGGEMHLMTSAPWCWQLTSGDAAVCRLNQSVILLQAYVGFYNPIGLLAHLLR